MITDKEPSEASTQELSSRSFAPAAILLALCLLFSLLRWLKTENFWGDSGRWIFEAWRSARGEVLYRDFAWQYGPLPLLLFAGAFRIFGATFAVAQVLLDLISTAVVYLTWQFGRRVLPPSIAFAAALALLGAGAGNTGNFALFSLQLYTPAILVGMAGFLLAGTEAIDHFRAGKWIGVGRWKFATGTAIALLSKPEFIVAVGGLFLVLAVIASYQGARRLRALAELVFLTFAPAAAIYATIAAIAGGHNLAEGIGGYGMAYLTCPWWPTGLGIFGALTALLQAAVLLALFSLTDVETFRNRYRGRYYLLWALAPIAIAASIVYLPYCMAEMPVFHSGRSLGNIVSFYLSTGTVLLPVMWGAIVLCIGAAVSAIRSAIRGHAPDLSTSLFLLLALPAVFISSRSLFGGTMSQLTVVAVAAYPLWFVLAPQLLLNITSARIARSAVLVVMMGYALLRLGTAAVLDWRTPYTKVITQAGAVKLQDATAEELYRYVGEHVPAGEPMLDLSYGGALNLATRHPSPIFSTQFSALAPSDRILARDLDLIQRRRPSLVIAPMEAGFGATYGICMDTGCPFPAFVFRSSTPACTPGKAFPVLSYIAEHYTPVAAIGSRVVYLPKQ